jgi:hypothetical protein
VSVSPKQCEDDADPSSDDEQPTNTLQQLSKFVESLVTNTSAGLAANGTVCIAECGVYIEVAL